MFTVILSAGLSFVIVSKLLSKIASARVLLLEIDTVEFFLHEIVDTNNLFLPVSFLVCLKAEIFLSLVFQTF